MNRIRTIAIVALCLALWTPLAVGADYINHFGQTNPTSEGWTYNGGTTVGGGSEGSYNYWSLNEVTVYGRIGRNGRV